MCKSSFFWVITFLICLTAGAVGATPPGDTFLKAIQVMPGTPLDERPAQTRFGITQLDTVFFGGHDGSGYAVEGGTWDFEDGVGGPDWQGWYGIDQTANSGVPWGARVTASSFDCPADAPMINGTVGQIWFGKHGDTADQECWVCDAGGDCTNPGTRVGYKNDLCQRADSPLLVYSGGDISVAFDFFLEAEGYPLDYVRVQIVPFLNPSVEMEAVTVKNVDDGSGGMIGDPDHPVHFEDDLSSAALPGNTSHIKLRFEFVSDVGWSDEDAGGGICTDYGPFGADDVSISESDVGQLGFYDFDSGDEGFTFDHCPGVGNYVALNPLDDYNILDPCRCDLQSWIMTFHDDSYQHPGDPDGQANMAVGPIVDRGAYPAEAGFRDVFMDYDIYAWLPEANGVLYRPGAVYYPWTCTETGASGWSPRIGDDRYYYVGTDPVCAPDRQNLTAWGLPGNADFYRLVMEVRSCCSCFGIEDCTGITNDTPLFDNFRLGIAGSPDAPVVNLATGGFQDGFAQDGMLLATSTGRSDDAARDAAVEPPYILGDSLGIAGPAVGGDTDPWQAYLWFRIQRKGPVQDDVSGYGNWKSRMMSASFPGDPEVQFVGVRMDSCQTGVNAHNNKFCSFAHPADGFYQGDPEADERADGNEILPDDAFTAGTRILYFITANYIDNPVTFFLPDTTGGFFLEYEILPSMRWSEGPGSDVVWPCVLYWDAYNRGAQNFIQPALDAFLQEVPGDGPNNDRYDELLASTNYNASSIYRLGVEANNGAALAQLLGYRGILLNTGIFSSGAMELSDMIGVEDWLLTTICQEEGMFRQGFIANGDEIAGIIERLRPSLLTGALGAGLECSPYRDTGCPSGTPEDTTFCAAVISSTNPVYPPPATYYAFGNGCPQIYTYSVLFGIDGVGNRDWFDYDFSGPKGVVSFAQIANDRSTGLANYRSVIDGYSYHHITTTFNDGTNHCEVDSAGRVNAAGNEIIAALNWMFDGVPPEFCINPCRDLSDAPNPDAVDFKVNRLYQNAPNPFNPRTVIRFSVAERGPMNLSIYDVRGRLVKRLAKETKDAGLHSLVWDGTDNEGHRVGSGIYWSQLRAGDYVSNKKMMLLR
jgi:hypothetical protein